MESYNYIGCYPVRIATRRFQNRKHRKRRINKKWLKRYGYTEFNYMPHDEAVLANGFLYMTRQTFDKLKEEHYEI